MLGSFFLLELVIKKENWIQVKNFKLLTEKVSTKIMSVISISAASPLISESNHDIYCTYPLFFKKRKCKVYYHPVFFVELLSYTKSLCLCIHCRPFQADRFQLWESIFLAISWLAYIFSYIKFLLIFLGRVF